MRDHHRFVLCRHLDLIDELTRQVERMEARIVEETSGSFGAALDLLASIPGVGQRWAEAILAETGDDMSKCSTAANFASWARVCPGNHESAGKRNYRALYYRRRARGQPAQEVGRRNRDQGPSRLSSHGVTPPPRIADRRDPEALLRSHGIPLVRSRPTPEFHGNMKRGGRRETRAHAVPLYGRSPYCNHQETPD